MPPKVEYARTEEGRPIGPILSQLNEGEQAGSNDGV
ncbi:winged helix-turn-helix transcriptional regulator [Caballeronia glebae]